jgi:hypothetical protein
MASHSIRYSFTDTGKPLCFRERKKSINIFA